LNEPGGAADSQLRFIVDHNVGKLARWLRMLGYDSVFFEGPDDSMMVRQALAEGRIILTRDTEIKKRRVAAEGRLKVILIASEAPDEQMRQLLGSMDLLGGARPFTLCLEDNTPLVERSPAEVRDRVPPYVFRTQEQYMECPGCRRVYWRGTHWRAMQKKLEEMKEL
jgi:uncharacterized protein with PIN domain